MSGSRLFILLLILYTGSHAAILAAEPNRSGAELDAIMEGFDEEVAEPDMDMLLEDFSDDIEQTVDHAYAPDTSPLPWQLNGALTLSSSYNYAHSAPAANETDHRGLSRLRSSLRLELKVDLINSWRGYAETNLSHDLVYQIQGRSGYSREQLDSQESEAVLGEAWVQGSLTRSLDLKLGRQLAVWGKSDNLRVTDILNPMDLRELGLVDIEDLRLPLSMARMDYYRGDWNLSALIIQEIRFDKTAQPGSDFYVGPSDPIVKKTPNQSRSNLEYAVALNGLFSGWDLSLYWARLFDDQPHLERVNGTATLVHSRLTMLGAATNIALGNWLLKGEIAHFRGLEFLAVPGQKKQRTDLLLGIEYSGFDDTTLTLEVVDRYLHNYTSALAAQGTEKNEWQTALRYSGEFMHARLKVTFLTLLFGTPEEGGGIARLQGDYEWTDNIRLIGGVVAYHSGDKRPFTRIGDNDRLFLDLKYSF